MTVPRSRRRVKKRSTGRRRSPQRSGAAGAPVHGVAEREVVLVNEQGLHARPAAMIVKEAILHEAPIRITRGSETVDARRILEVLTIASPKGTVLRIRAEGPGADRAVDAVAALIAGRFGEGR